MLEIRAPLGCGDEEPWTYAPGRHEQVEEKTVA